MELSKAMCNVLNEAARAYGRNPEVWLNRSHFSGTRNTLNALVARGLLDVRGDVRYWGGEIAADLREYRISNMGIEAINAD